jgi:NAD(P)-dependent dehydrogenase (short-subunit alcohol dehydrogenase family)
VLPRGLPGDAVGGLRPDRQRRLRHDPRRNPPRALATELAPYGITVNSVAPGLTATEAVVGTEHEQYLDRSRSLQAIQRYGRPEDIAPVVAFLASEEAAWVTSSMIVANGGKERY